MQKNHEKPLISIIIPCYNAARFLPTALASVQQQQGGDRLFDTELILIDDGSTDDTEQVVAQYPIVHYIKQSNKGPAAARNHGIRLAQGTFIAFLDADDQWASDTLQTLLQGFHEHPDCQIAGGQVSYIFAEPALAKYYALEQGKGRFVHIGSRLYRRTVFNSVGFFDEQFAYSEDLDFYNRVADAGIPVTTSAGTVLYYFVHGQNTSVQKSSITMEVMKVIRKTLQRRRETHRISK